MPDFDFTLETSEALIDPFTVTSSRKFELSAAWPDFHFVRLTSEAFTEPFPVVSPRSTPIGTLHVACIRSVADSEKCNDDCLSVGHSRKVNSYLPAINCEAIYAPGAGGDACTR